MAILTKAGWPALPAKMTPLRIALGLFLATAAVLPAMAQEGFEPEFWEFFGEIELEGTAFFEGVQFEGQDRDDISFAGQTTFLAEWLNGDLVLRVTPFARYDIQDDRRTHADLREAKVDYTSGDWTFRIGADTVFWGKTEAVRLVNIINQVDAIEDLDEEDLLGQPMLRVGYLADLGEFSAFFLPYFRERPFPGEDGRLRFDPPVNTANPIYETEAEEFTPSFALRYSGFIGEFDLGLSYFHGLGRDPSLFFDGTELLPVYQRINQVGIDGQFTSGATLWKLEGIFRQGEKNAQFEEEVFGALTGGLEHTLFGIFESNADLGIIAEGAWDSRGDDAQTTFENDAIGGVRLSLNDTQDTAFLVTSSVDVTDGSVGLRMEAERRVGENWTLELEAVGFVNQPSGTFDGAFADDSFVRLKIKRFF
ncbi:MAG: hypothetical protein AAGD08_00380 [Pseudomonadota bacterium]